MKSDRGKQKDAEEEVELEEIVVERERKKNGFSE